MSQTCVVKLGGEVVADAAQLAVVLRDAAQLVEAGWRVAVCHGGGAQTSALSRQLGLEPQHVAGQRVTDAPTLRAACQAIAGEVGCIVTAAAWDVGLQAVGVSAGVVHGRRRPPQRVASEGGREVDYGLVGDISRLELGPILACWDRGLTPVINPIAVAPGGQLLNINADTVASALAAQLRVGHLFLVTRVGGVLRERDDPGSRIPSLGPAEVRAAIDEGVIAGGMIPKVEEALGALEGAGAVHILPPEPGTLAAAAADPGCRGTVLRGPSGGEGPRA